MKKDVVRVEMDLKKIFLTPPNTRWEQITLLVMMVVLFVMFFGPICFTDINPVKAIFLSSLPALSVAAAYDQGDTHFTSLAHVRVKETDRVAVMQEVLTACGADVEITADSMTVHGGRPLTGASVDSHDDHRVAMAMAVCGLLADGEMKISDPECAAVSFPGFYESMNKIGAGFVLK